MHDKKLEFQAICSQPLVWASVLVILTFTNTSAQDQGATQHPEPNADIASRWWPEMENVWTPIGWKNHTLRGNVVYNGTVVIEPKKKPLAGKGVQIEFIPSRDGAIPKPFGPYYPLARKYGRSGNQGWREGATPVLWTDWNRDGLTLRKEIFAHVAGAGDVGTKVEPLYFWIRLSIQEMETPDSERKHYWLLKINKPHLQLSMRRQSNLVVSPKRESAYPRGLKMESIGNGTMASQRVVEDDGKIRLGIGSSFQHQVDLIDLRPDAKDAYLRIEMPAKKDAYVDLLLAATPVDRALFESEFRLGREQALAQSDRYWSKVPATAARVDTPEPLINETIRHNLKFAELMALRLPHTGQHCQTSGSWHYEQLWPTPTSMSHTMLLDVMGYHDVSAKYLTVYREHQGTRTPPGQSYGKHPGYLSAPESMTSIDWISDHGAILHAVCNHALLTDDRQFIDEWLNSIILGCEFIRDSIASKGHGGVVGILPPAVATDLQDEVQAVWSDGWNYKGLTTAVRLLGRLKHPRAAEFAQVAADYKTAHNQAIREKARSSETWTDARGRKRRYVPTLLFGDRKRSAEIRGKKEAPYWEHPFYLDTGPLFLVDAGLMDADDPLMKESLEYFRSGPNQFDINGSFPSPPSLHHELSSCEPCYSWNVMHSHQLEDRYRYFEGMYSLFAGGLSRQTYISSETRGGISGTIFSAPLAIWLARQAVIDDQVEPGRLHLLRMSPQAWLRNDKETVFEKMPTEFGPVSLRFKLREQSRVLEVSFEPKFRTHPTGITLHIPPLEGLQHVVINGEKHSVRPASILQIQSTL